jgi:transcriptional regulator with XRE-family HTH domain
MDMANKDDVRNAEAPEQRVQQQPSRDVPAIVGRNLKALRKAQNFSLEGLAEVSGVSRAMLGQIETGKSVPTVGLLWKIADALGVPVGHLIATPSGTTTVILEKKGQATIASSQGRFVRRPLFPIDGVRGAEFYELHIAPGHSEVLSACPAGTQKNLVVASGSLVFTVGTEPAITLEEGDAAQFLAESPQILKNPGDKDTVAYLVVTRLGRPAA